LFRRNSISLQVAGCKILENRERIRSWKAFRKIHIFLKHYHIISFVSRSYLRDEQLSTVEIKIGVLSCKFRVKTTAARRYCGRYRA